MRAINIAFNGCKRLANTSCNTDGRMIAFLGPNEAGKSTVLQALDWFSNAGAGSVPHIIWNRSKPPTDAAPVVRVRYALDDDDRSMWADLPAAGKPSTLVIERHLSGEVRVGLEPALTRDPAPFEALNARLSDFEQLWEAIVHFDTIGDPDDQAHQPMLQPWIDAAGALVADPEGGWQAEWETPIAEFTNWLRDRPDEDQLAGLPLPPAGPEGSRDGTLADLIDQVVAIRKATHPNDDARGRAHRAAPGFVFFTAQDRELVSVYELSDENLRANPPKALANLLWVAGLNLADLWTAIETSNTGVARTLERRANAQLAERLGAKWSQEDITVALNVSGTTLEVLVVEGSEEGANTPFSERSDGLRMFIALVAFLARKQFAVPPILLVDEAEMHLHYDAQADLIEVLINDIEATQVFYTTHSPGCLPRDLGTGIRLVAPDPKQRDASKLANDFWTNKQPGFTPLLFAMGAGAAAFSAFRRAVLAEGAADMILLPSLIRLATGHADLDYQVAPGIANYNGTGIELEETAARVAYLLDGDSGGDEHRQRLTDMGIDDSRIFNLEAGNATEDYVHPDRYLEVVNTFLADKAHPTVASEDLMGGIPIAKALADWCKERGIDAPSKTAVASRLVGAPEALKLADGAADFLADLHKRINEALKA